MAWGGGRRFPWSTLLSCLAPRCPFLGDNYRTQLVPVGPASPELPFPTHHQRFVLSTFAFVDSASQVALEGEVRRGPHIKRVRRGKSECRGRSSYFSQVLTFTLSLLRRCTCRTKLIAVDLLPGSYQHWPVTH